MLPQQIETGVDKLIELVLAKGRIDVKDAACKLGVGPMVVQELAAYLEEEGLIGIEYQLHKVTLVSRKFSPKEAHERAKEVAQHKDLFIHRVDNAIVQIERDANSFTSLKKEFAELQESLGGDLTKIKGQIQELAGLDDIKGVCDKRIAEHEERMQTVLARSDERIGRIEKRHEQVAEAIEATKRLVVDHQKKLAQAVEQRNALRNRLFDLSQSVSTLHRQLGSDTKQMHSYIKTLRKLELEAEGFRKETERHKQLIVSPMRTLSEKHVAHITQMHQAIARQADDVRTIIKRQTQTGEEATRKFVTFFDKRIQVESLLERISAKQESLKRSLAALKKKGMALSITTRSMNGDEMTALETQLAKVESQRSWISQEMQKLAILLKH